MITLTPLHCIVSSLSWEKLRRKSTWKMLTMKSLCWSYSLTKNPISAMGFLRAWTVGWPYQRVRHILTHGYLSQRKLALEILALIFGPSPQIIRTNRLNLTCIPFESIWTWQHRSDMIMVTMNWKIMIEIESTNQCWFIFQCLTRAKVNITVHADFLASSFLDTYFLIYVCCL